jgi:outer membrane protein TolC
MRHDLKLRESKRKFLVIVLMMSSFFISAQPVSRLSLEEAQKMARENYPLIRQKDLIAKTSQLTLENIGKSYLPQFSVSGQATWQNEVTELPYRLPGLSVEPLDQDMYKLQAEVQQILYDGGVVRNQRSSQEWQAKVEDQQTEVELYRLRDQVNQLYISIKLYDEQMKQNVLVKNDLETAMKSVSARVENGTAFRSEQLTIEAELLINEQRREELISGRRALVQVLALLTGKEILPDVQLDDTPDVITNLETGIVRPEMLLYRYQDSLFSSQKQLIQSRNLPRASLFAQGGYGRPGLNMLLNEFRPYFYGGLRLQWPLGGYYTASREKQIIDQKRMMIDIQRDMFLLNTNMQVSKEAEELRKYQTLILLDDKIVEKRTRIKESSLAQLDNGVITSRDYVREVNAEAQSRSARSLHQLKQWLTQLNIQTITGN